MEEKIKDLPETERYIGSFEGKLICMRESNIIPTDFTTPLLYGRFHSYYERSEAQFEKEPEVERGLRAEKEMVDIFLDEEDERSASLKTSFVLLRELSSFAKGFSC